MSDLSPTITRRFGWDRTRPRPPLGRLRPVYWDHRSPRLAFDDTEFKEQEHPRDTSGKFTKGAGAGPKPTPAKGAVVVDPIAKILKSFGYSKKKGTLGTFSHPEGHEVEAHAAKEGQKWLTGWSHGDTTKAGAGSLKKHLEQLHGKGEAAKVFAAFGLQGLEDLPKKEPTPAAAEPAVPDIVTEFGGKPGGLPSNSSIKEYNFPNGMTLVHESDTGKFKLWGPSGSGLGELAEGTKPAELKVALKEHVGKQEPLEATKTPKPEGVVFGFHNALTNNGFEPKPTDPNSGFVTYKNPQNDILIEVSKGPPGQLPSETKWTIYSAKDTGAGTSLQTLAATGTGLIGMYNSLAKTKQSLAEQPTTTKLLPSPDFDSGTPGQEPTKSDIAKLGAWLDASGFEQIAPQQGWYHSWKDAEGNKVNIYEEGGWGWEPHGWETTKGTANMPANGGGFNSLVSKVTEAKGAPKTPLDPHSPEAVQQTLKENGYHQVGPSSWVNEDHGEKVSLGVNGMYTINNMSTGEELASGFGANTLNSDFEALHPRGAGGQFVKKAGGEAVTLPKGVVELPNVKQENTSWELQGEKVPTFRTYWGDEKSPSYSILIASPDYEGEHAGKWQIYTAAGGVVATGTGQQSLNEAVEKHPPPGKTAAPAPAPAAPAAAAPAPAPTPAAPEKPVAPPAVPSSMWWNLPFKLPKKHGPYRFSLASKGFKPTTQMQSHIKYENANGDLFYLARKAKKGDAKLQWIFKQQPGLANKYGSGIADFNAFIGNAYAKPGATGPMPLTPTAAPAPSLPAGTAPSWFISSPSASYFWELHNIATKTGFNYKSTNVDGDALYKSPDNNYTVVLKKNGDWKLIDGNYFTVALGNQAAGTAPLQISIEGAGLTPTPAAPATPTKPPEGIEDLMPHTKEYPGTGMKLWSDTADINNSNEQISITPDGKWTIWQKGQGTIAEGTGTEALNQAFEQLHPRGPGGKFMKKNNNDEHFTTNGPVPDSLNGVAFSKWTPPSNWSTVTGTKPDLKEPPVTPNLRAGLLIQEPDGRVWLAKPANAYGGYNYTFPKGGMSGGLSAQQTAIKEAWEETGLKCEITGYAGDYAGTTSTTRYYFAKRTGGTPTAYGHESEGVSLVPPEKLKQFLNMERDIKIADNHFGTGTPAKAAVAPSATVPLTVSSMKKIGEKLGTNPGGRYEDASGKQYYVKWMQTSDHAKNEILAAALYRAAGGNTLSYRPILDDSGKMGVATEWQTLDKDNISQLTPEERKEAQKDFALQAWIANWDAAGQDNSNIGVANGKVIPLDVGGGLRYRAQGLPKELKPDAPEWESLRDSTVNKNTAALYGSMTPAELKASAMRLKQVTDQQITDLAKQFGPEDEGQRNTLIYNLKSRRNKIIQKGEEAGEVHQAGVGTYKPGSSKSQANLVTSPTQPTLSHEQVYKTLNALRKPPSSAEQSSFSKYTGNFYRMTNSAMRTFVGEEGEDVADHIPEVGHMRDYIGRHTTDKPLTLFRGVKGSYGKQIKNAIQGAINYGAFKNGKTRTFDDKAFISVSTDKGTADGFGASAGGITFILEVPAGTIGVSADNYAEEELLLQAGTRFIMDGSVDQATGLYRLKVDQSHMQKPAAQKLAA